VDTRIGVWPLLALLCPLLVACNWVDSTGAQGVAPVTEVFLDDTPIGSAVVMNEKTQRSIRVSQGAAGDENLTYQWSDAAIQEGMLATCTGVDGFNPDFAASTLEEACTDPSQCSVNFEPVTTADGGTGFLLGAPELRASVGLRYTLSVDSIETRELDFCFVAINEAPNANDDTFTIRENIREVISIDSEISLDLLSNDSDDIDDRNIELHVLTDPSVAPSHAKYFELRDDGSFVYHYLSSPEGLLEDASDSFEYEVSDGVLTSTALVTLKIVANNRVPEQDAVIPFLNARVGTYFSENLSLYFSDPEGGYLTYSFPVGVSFPLGSGLTLSNDGILSGTPLLADVGSFQFPFLVSDGARELESLISLEVEVNAAPVYVSGTVASQSIFLGAFLGHLLPEFVDANNDELVYSMFGAPQLPAGVTLDSSTGIISGRPLTRTLVNGLRIQATDPYGASAVSGFFYILVQ